MIDFTNGSFIKLKPTKINPNDKYTQLLIEEEEVLQSYKGVRDMVVFTTKRILVINVQGLTGKKIDYTSIPYSKINTFSIESAGIFDLDSELEIYISGLGKLRFEFTGNSDIVEISKYIATNIF